MPNAIQILKTGFLSSLIILVSCEENTIFNSSCDNPILLENIRPGSASESWLPSPQQTFVQYTSQGKIGTIQYQDAIAREYQYSQTDIIQCIEDSSKIQSVKYDVFSYKIKGELDSDILKGNLIFQIHVLNDRKYPLTNRRLEYLEIKFENLLDTTSSNSYILLTLPTLNKDYPFQVEYPLYFPEINIENRIFKNVYSSHIPALDSLEIYYSKSQKLLAFKNQKGAYVLP